MTKKELEERCFVLQLLLQSYEEWKHEKTHRERSTQWNPKWKHVKNILTKYNIKLTHIADFGENEAQYNSLYNEIFIMPRQMFVNMEDNEHMGICRYYLNLWHEIFHAIINHEFHLAVLLNENAEEIIVEEAVQKFVLKDICGDYSYSHEDTFEIDSDGDISVDIIKAEDKFLEDSEEYITTYHQKLYDDPKSYEVFEKQKEIIQNKIKEVYETSRP